MEVEQMKQDLEVKKEILAERKEQRIRLETERDRLTKQMKEEYGCETIGELHDKITVITNELEDARTEFARGLQELNTLMN